MRSSRASGNMAVIEMARISALESTAGIPIDASVQAPVREAGTKTSCGFSPKKYEPRSALHSTKVLRKRTSNEDLAQRSLALSAQSQAAILRRDSELCDVPTPFVPDTRPDRESARTLHPARAGNSSSPAAYRFRNRSEVSMARLVLPRSMRRLRCRQQTRSIIEPHFQRRCSGGRRPRRATPRRRRASVPHQRPSVPLKGTSFREE